MMFGARDAVCVTLEYFTCRENRKKSQIKKSFCDANVILSESFLEVHLKVLSLCKHLIPGRNE